MKVTTTFAAVVGALAVLAPLTSAAAVAPRDSIAIGGDNLEARAQSPSQAARQRAEEAKRKAALAKARAQEAARRRKKNRKSSKLPTSTTPLARAVTTSTRAATSTKATTTSRAATTSKPATSSVRATTTTSSKPATTTSTSTNTTFTNFQNDILNIHNVDRARHSASPLVWDSTVAAAAAKWAAGCKWAHTPNNPYGQNIAAGTWDTFGAKDTTDLWYDEYKLYDYNKAQYSDATGHFTQMVWKGSKKLGCAIQKCTAQQMGLGSSGNANFVVCNYDPPGNWIGEFKENVSPN